jgi:hypothetical protein
MGVVWVDLEMAEGDIRVWMDHVLSKDKQYQQSVRGIQILVPIVMALVGYLGSNALGAAVFFIVGLLMSLFFVPWAWGKQIERRIASELAGLADGAVGPQSLELNDDVIRWTTTAVDAHWQRSAIRTVEVTDTHAFIMVSRSSALIFPLRPDPDGHRRRIVDEIRR